MEHISQYSLRQAQRLEQMMCLSREGNRSQAAEIARELKTELGLEQYEPLKRQYFAARQGSALEGHTLQPGERTTTQAEYKVQSSAKRNFLGQQSYKNCGPQTCQQIIYAITGRKLSEAEMESIAFETTNYDRRDGTQLVQLPNLLRSQGIESGLYINDPENIQLAVEHGLGVITPHDAVSLWKDDDAVGRHVVHVTGLKKDENGNVTHYIINDTGKGTVGQEVDAKTFESSLDPELEAVITYEPLSYGGSAASEQRRRNLLKTEEPAQYFEHSAASSKV
jgi:hypothetical protein